MLVITRADGEAFRIGDDIIVTVCTTTSNADQVKLGIAAPDDVLILREELVEDDEDF